MPGDPLGAYSVTARQQNLRATGGFALHAASRPRLVVVARDAQLDQRLIEPGQTLTLVLAGFPARQTIALHLYRQERGANCGGTLCEQYLTTIRVPVDQDGQAITTLATRPDDPPGSYRFVTEPALDADLAAGLSAFSVLGDAPGSAARQMVTAGGALNLWVDQRGAERVGERPRLYEGSLLTVLTTTPDSVEVRTDDDVHGWLLVPESALSGDLAQQGERVRFAIRQRVQVVWANGLPLRAEPRSTAVKLRPAVKAGTEATVEELRGDWLRVTLGDGTPGWLRWYYDGQIYIEALSD